MQDDPEVRTRPFNKYYSQRFSLCVLDILRKLQNELQEFDNGIWITDIIRHVAEEDFADGDVSSQVETTLCALENCGFVRKCTGDRYKTLGPFARLNIAKGPKHKIRTWDRIESQILH